MWEMILRENKKISIHEQANIFFGWYMGYKGKIYILLENRKVYPICLMWHNFNWHNNM